VPIEVLAVRYRVAAALETQGVQTEDHIPMPGQKPTGILSWVAREAGTFTFTEMVFVVVLMPELYRGPACLGTGWSTFRKEQPRLGPFVRFGAGAQQLGSVTPLIGNLNGFRIQLRLLGSAAPEPEQGMVPEPPRGGNQVI